MITPTDDAVIREYEAVEREMGGQAKASPLEAIDETARRLGVAPGYVRGVMLDRWGGLSG